MININNMSRRNLLLAITTSPPPTTELQFPVYLVEGDNGQLGIDVYNYIFEKCNVNVNFTEELYFKGTSYSAFDGRIIGLATKFDNYLVLILQNSLGAANLFLHSNGTVILNIFG